MTNLERELWVIEQQLALLQQKLTEDVFSLAETEEITELDLLQEILDLLKSNPPDCL